jgi:hypothetical protein
VYVQILIFQNQSLKVLILGCETAPPVTGPASGGRWRLGTGCTTRKSTSGSVSRRGRGRRGLGARMRLKHRAQPVRQTPSHRLRAVLEPTALATQDTLVSPAQGRV